MIHEVKGDLTTYDADFICHQTNFHGVMGGGVALAIWNKMLERQARAAYQIHCAKNGANLLGTVQFLPAVQRTPDGDRMCIVYNLFCQADEPQDDGGITHYDSMRECLEQVERLARRSSRTVALPGYIGCGIAGAGALCGAEGQRSAELDRLGTDAFAAVGVCQTGGDLVSGGDARQYALQDQ